MINSTSIYGFPLYNQNYEPKILPISSNYINLHKRNSRSLDSFFSKNNLHKKIYTNFLTEQNYNIKNIPISTINLYNGNISLYNIGNNNNNYIIKDENNNFNALSDISINNLTNYYLDSSFNYNSPLKNLNLFLKEEEPNSNFKLSDFIILNQIGKGGEGVIYTVKWKKNNKKYAMKKCQILHEEDIKKRIEDNQLINEFIRITGCSGVIKTYGNLCHINSFTSLYDFYEIMELAEKDWEKEILWRNNNQLFYQEYELMEIFGNLIKTFSLLQNKNITHRDIKPQNIMIINGNFKICDFGNSRILKNGNIIVQKIRGSEIFMSPILFKGYRSGRLTIRHNTFKSDVFSLGMCFLLAATLNYRSLNHIRELYNMKIIRRILDNYLGKRYSEKLINLLLIMLQIEENNRPDFSQLEILL